MGMFDTIKSWYKTDSPSYTVPAPADQHTADTTSEYSKSVAAQEQGQKDFQQQGANWLNSRQGYYDQLYNGMQQAGGGQIKYGEEDALRQQRYAAAARGNVGGSADLSGQAGIQSAAAQQYGQLNQQAQSTVDQQKLVDQQTVSQLYQQYANNPAMTSQYNAEMAASQARSGYSPDMAAAAQQGWQNAQTGYGLASSGLGQGLSTLANSVSVAGRLGYFNPQSTGGYSQVSPYQQQQGFDANSGWYRPAGNTGGNSLTGYTGDFGYGTSGRQQSPDIMQA